MNLRSIPEETIPESADIVWSDEDGCFILVA